MSKVKFWNQTYTDTTYHKWQLTVQTKKFIHLCRPQCSEWGIRGIELVQSLKGARSLTAILSHVVAGFEVFGFKMAGECLSSSNEAFSIKLKRWQYFYLSDISSIVDENHDEPYDGKCITFFCMLPYTLTVITHLLLES